MCYPPRSLHNADIYATIVRATDTWQKQDRNCISSLSSKLRLASDFANHSIVPQTNYLNQSTHRGDTAKFLRKYRPEAVSAVQEFDIVIIADAENHQGPYNKSDPDYAMMNIEGNLDAQLALSMTWPTPLTVYNTGGCVSISATDA